MKKLIVTLIIFALSSFSVADEDNVIRISDAVKAGNVVVKPNKEYTLDLSGYEVPEDARLIILHVLDTPKSNYYSQEIEHGTSVYKMNSDTLKAAAGSPPFRGLDKSNGAFLIIGSEVAPGSIDMGILYGNESIAVTVRD